MVCFGKDSRKTLFGTDPVNVGKQWHAPKKAFRPTAGLKSYEKRTQERALLDQIKAKEKEMKEEKEAERKVRTGRGSNTNTTID